MYFELGLVLFVIIVILFLAFWVTAEGSSWQKHKFLGVFARIIQTSARRSFLIFFFFTIMMIPASLLIVQGYWIDAIISDTPPANTVPVVSALLLMFLMLSGMIPVMWGRYRVWRQSARASADVRVRTTA
jgi:hypothetical protein